MWLMFTRLNSTLYRRTGPLVAAARPYSSARKVHALPVTISRFRNLVVGRIPQNRRWATSTTPHSVAADPAEAEALSCLEQGTQRLEEGDVEGAKSLYQRSVEIRRSASSLFNLGVTHYHLKDFEAAIKAWEECIELSPGSADAHTNLASAYILSPVAPKPNLALHHLQIASELSPEDAEIAFNLAAVLEAGDHLEEALENYRRAKKYGVQKAEVHIRNISAKLLGRKMKEMETLSKDEK